MQTTMTDFINDFSRTICSLTENKVYSTVIFLCLGTDRVTGDTFGPIVGHKLKQFYGHTKNIEIFGDLDKTVCNNNIEEWVKIIRGKYANPFIISIDSALSCNDKNIGKIIVAKGGIILGSSLGKNNYSIGNMNIKGIVARNLGNPRQNFRLLQNIHLGDIVKMADVVASGIFNSIDLA